MLLLAEKASPLRHVSATRTVALGSDRFRHLVILPSTQSLLEELKGFRKRFYFLSTPNGWTSRRDFLL
jgi:hypothetical protein